MIIGMLMIVVVVAVIIIFVVVISSIGSSTACYDVGYFTGQGRNVPLRSSASCPGNQQLNLGTWINVTIAWRLIIARVWCHVSLIFSTVGSIVIALFKFVRMRRQRRLARLIGAVLQYLTRLSSKATS